MLVSHVVLSRKPSASSSIETSTPSFARSSRRPWHLSSSRRRSSSGVSMNSVSQKSKVTPATLNLGAKSTPFPADPASTRSPANLSATLCLHLPYGSQDHLLRRGEYSILRIALTQRNMARVLGDRRVPSPTLDSRTGIKQGRCVL